VRVVLDSNIYVSAIASPGGRAERAIQAALAGQYELSISRPIIREVLDVLARKFDRNPEELARVAVFLAELGEVVHPRKSLHVLRDEPDNRILECAVAAQADAIVTGDRAMLELGQFHRVRILPLREFLGMLASGTD
jgi:putative PIN family toxin of toxin-antitoxin system